MTTSHVADPARGAGWAVATATAYSLSSIVGKDLLTRLGIPSMLFWRFGLAAAVLWVIVAVRRRTSALAAVDYPRGAVFALGALFGWLIYVGFLSLERLDASVYIVLVYLYPVVVVVGSSLLGHRIAPLTWAALGLVIVGVVLTVPEVFTGVGSVDSVGVALALGQAVLFAGFLMVNSRIVPVAADGVVTAAWTVLGAAVAVVPAVVVDGLVLPEGALLVGEVAMFALVPTVVSNICFFRALRHLPAGVVAMVLTLEVALAMVWSVLLLDETVGLIRGLGAATVVGAVLLAQWTTVSGRSGAVVTDPIAAR